jgi:hypothetical protein
MGLVSKAKVELKREDCLRYANIPALFGVRCGRPFARERSPDGFYESEVIPKPRALDDLTVMD